MMVEINEFVWNARGQSHTVMLVLIGEDGSTAPTTMHVPRLSAVHVPRQAEERAHGHRCRNLQTWIRWWQTRSQRVGL